MEVEWNVWSLPPSFAADRKCQGFRRWDLDPRDDRQRTYVVLLGDDTAPKSILPACHWDMVYEQLYIIDATDEQVIVLLDHSSIVKVER